MTFKLKKTRKEDSYDMDIDVDGDWYIHWENPHKRSHLYEHDIVILRDDPNEHYMVERKILTENGQRIFIRLVTNSLNTGFEYIPSGMRYKILPA